MNLRVATCQIFTRAHLDMLAAEAGANSGPLLRSGDLAILSSG